MKMKKQLLGLLGLVVVMAALFWVYTASRPASIAGEKQVAVTIVHANGDSRELQLKTQAETLGDLLCEQPGLIEYSESTFGRYLRVVDGEAEDAANQLWWCITKDGQPHNTGMDSTVIADGERYELTMKKGYDQK